MACGEAASGDASRTRKVVGNRGENRGKTIRVRVKLRQGQFYKKI